MSVHSTTNKIEIIALDSLIFRIFRRNMNASMWVAFWDILMRRLEMSMHSIVARALKVRCALASKRLHREAE